MVSDSDAVVNPGAVVVESLHATVANGAVARPWRPNYLAIGAQLTWMYVLQECDEV